MRNSRFTEEQIIALLAEQERGLATAEVCRKHGIKNKIPRPDFDVTMTPPGQLRLDAWE